MVASAKRVGPRVSRGKALGGLRTRECGTGGSCGAGGAAVVVAGGVGGAVATARASTRPLRAA